MTRIFNKLLDGVYLSQFVAFLRPIKITCLGAFLLAVTGQEIDLSGGNDRLLGRRKARKLNN
ncbi:MAG: hypothetical protein CMQ06_07935 [Gammaproteobacteria bacterium]|nr:hypothetical protein [Gammaproteobacteria bacterium]